MLIVNDIIVNGDFDITELLLQFQKSHSHDDTWIHTYSGRKINYLTFCSLDVDIEDIAHALSNICRFGGQCNQRYSVAEHSVLVSQYVESSQGATLDGVRSALMHDAAEAYIGDVPTPLKRLLPGFKLIERRFEDAILEAFDLRIDFSDELVKKADYEMYLRECSHLINAEIAEDHLPHLPMIRCLGPDDAKALFLNRVAELGVESKILPRI
ncbi:MAG TPA: hypothetical protein VJ521_05830 [Acidobacteriota bacterium]|nr:hypothetical protein [Acidobacteriota bacterium]